MQITQITEISLTWDHKSSFFHSKVVSVWGLHPQIPTEASPLDPNGGLLSPRSPGFAPPERFPGYATANGKPIYDFLLVNNTDFSCQRCSSDDLLGKTIRPHTLRYRRWLVKFLLLVGWVRLFSTFVWGDPVNLGPRNLAQRIQWCLVSCKPHFDILSRFDVDHECDRQTDGQAELRWQFTLRLTTRAKIQLWELQNIMSRCFFGSDSAKGT